MSTVHSVDATWQDIVADGEGVLSFDDVVAANEILFRDARIQKSNRFDSKSEIIQIL